MTPERLHDLAARGTPRYCRNCGERIVQTELDRWTHGPYETNPPPWRGPLWQGVRCPGRLTGATP